MLTEILVFIITTLIGYYLYVYKRIHNNFKQKDVKFLPGVPFYGNVLNSTLMRKHLFEDLDAVYRAFPEEKYVGYIEGITPVILIRDPELIKMTTVKDFDHFVNHTDFFTEEMEPLFGQSLIMMKGGKWHDMRSALSPAFTGSKMRMMMQFIQEISKNLMEYLKDHIGEDINVNDVTHRYTTDVIASAAFGVQLNSLKDRNNEFFMMGQGLFEFTTMQRIYQFFASQFPNLAKKLRLNSQTKTTKFFTDLVTTAMEYREKNNVVRPDMIQLLMEASKGTLKSSVNVEKDNVGFATVSDDVKQTFTTRVWSQSDLASQVLTFFVAGYETSSSTLTMCLHELALHPEIQERLYEEIKEFQERSILTFENVKELKYLDCVLNETFRKWSVSIMIDRVCTKTYVLPPPHEGGKPYTVNPGDVIYNASNSIHMDHKYYPEPEVFNPERFSEENKRNIKPFTFMPFGVGPRACLGSRFALLEMKVFLFDLISNFKVLKCDKTTNPIVLRPVDFNINALGGTWVKLEART